MPKATEDPEARETLALKAAADDENNSTPADGESYIEKYLKGVSEVESILALDRLRQVCSNPARPRSVFKYRILPV